MTFEFVIIILIVRYLRQLLSMSVTMPDWDKILMWTMYGVIAMIGLQLSTPIPDSIFQLVAYAILGGLIYILSKDERFKPARFLITAIAPYIVAVVFTHAVKIISPEFYKKWHELIDAVNTFAIIWGLGTWWVTNRQQKELVKAREKAKEETENNKVITAMKAELEVQVAERTAELTMQKNELENALHELKSTQAQLIQAEKMASLGELTAGIAHEIQNPLNFVNNFSEVNTELIEELKGEKARVRSERDEQLEEDILNDIAQNLEKISHHGKRADAIVKGMLQHSRKNTGQKELTDINALCDEYLRLSYHGLRAKDKSFNATFTTHFEEHSGKINIVPQDIGRVLLNLFNNAFYAVNEKKKTAEQGLLAGQAGYKPLVSVTTKSTLSEEGRNEITVIVQDNGNGIPQPVIDKIFQPFFTTKPTGQGTGLGLSLSYDIIKAHGGEIKAVTKEGEGSEFIVELPIA